MLLRLLESQLFFMLGLKLHISIIFFLIQLQTNINNRAILLPKKRSNLFFRSTLRQCTNEQSALLIIFWRRLANKELVTTFVIFNLQLSWLFAFVLNIAIVLLVTVLIHQTHSTHFSRVNKNAEDIRFTPNRRNSLQKYSIIGIHMQTLSHIIVNLFLQFVFHLHSNPF